MSSMYNPGSLFGILYILQRCTPRAGVSLEQIRAASTQHDLFVYRYESLRAIEMWQYHNMKVNINKGDFL